MGKARAGVDLLCTRVHSPCDPRVRARTRRRTRARTARTTTRGERVTVVTWMNWKGASTDDGIKVESSVLVGVLWKRERRSVEFES